MRVVRTPEQPGHAGQWETIRYAIDSNARTIRLCLILIVVISAPSLALTATGLLPHLLPRLLGQADRHRRAGRGPRSFICVVPYALHASYKSASKRYLPGKFLPASVIFSD